MNIEELINSNDIEIATMYCNIYLQTHALWQLDNILKKYQILSFTNNTVVLKEIMITWNQASNVWLRDPTKSILIAIK